MNLVEFRQNNPEYAHLSPEALSQLLYDNNPEFKKSGVSLEDFSLKMGVEEDRISRLPDRGFISELGHAIPRGIREGYGMGLKASHVAGKSLGLPEALYPSEEYIEGVEEKTDSDLFYMRGQLAEKEGLAKDVISGVESAATSMAAMAPGAMTGLATTAVGGPISATVGTIAGAATSGGVMFGGGEYYDFIKTAEDLLGPVYLKKYTDQGHSQEEAVQLAAKDIYEVASPQALKSAMAEGVFEGASNIADLLIFKGGVKAVTAPVKAGIKAKLLKGLGAYGKNVLKLASVEVPTEMATGASQALSYKPIYEEAGLEAPDPAEWAKESIIPTLAAVGLGFAPVATAGQRIARPRQPARQEGITEDTQPRHTQEDLIQGIQGIKSSLDNGDVTSAQLREALKELPEDHIHALAINQVLEAESPTARPIDLTAPKPTGEDYLARERNQEEIDKTARREETVEQLKQNLNTKLQVEEAAAEEQYWQDSEAEIAQQQRERDITAGRERLGETRPTTVQQPVFTENVSRETAPVSEKTDIALEGAGATIPIEKKQGEVAGTEKIAQPPALEEVESDRRQKQLKSLRIKEKRTGEERRTDEIRRKKVSELLPEEKDIEIRALRKEARQDHRTPLLNQKAFEDDKMEEDRTSPMAQVDLEKFKWVNDDTVPGTLPTGEKVKGSYPLGNDILKVFGKAIDEALIENGIKDKTKGYRSGGDEFTIVGATPGELESFTQTLEEKASKIKVDIFGADGVQYVLNGVPFSRGIGEGYDNAIQDYRANKADRTKSGLRLTGRSAHPATLLRAGEEKIGRDSEGDSDHGTVKKGFRRKKEQPSKVRTLRGAIKALGGIKFLNFKGELKDMPTAVKYLQRKNGVGIDQLVDMLIDDNWLEPGTSVSDFLENLRTDSKRLLSRDRLTADLSDKKEYQKFAEEKKFEKELAHEPEAPPEGKYIQMNAEDLPTGKKLTLLDGKSPDGWDIYTVEEKDPFSVTLKDGIEIELKPLDRVEVLKKDLQKPSEAAESIKPETQPDISEKEEVIKKPAQAKPDVEKKAPWEMTLSEYESIHGKPRKGATSYTENTFHKNAVHVAINQGKGVPSEVLKDYPDLQKKPPTDMFGQPVPTDMFGKAVPEAGTPKRETRERKEKRTPTQAQKPLFGEDATQIQPELPLGKKPSEKDTLKTVTPEMGKGLKYEYEVQIEESGEVLKISEGADQALKNIDEQILSYKILRDCI